ncbi:MAG TPA: type II CAAX endopeptidase family protein [Terracidiphilus sp.]|nr:type II CAAX endopeptidase family protein [Terracidiphilus sp.]
MSPMPPFAGKMRAYLEFIAAVIYILLARSTAHRAAFQIAGEEWAPLTEQLLLLALLVAIFSAFGRFFDGEHNPVAAQGLPFRRGWTGEVGTGLAVGWGAAVFCGLALVLMGGIAIVLSTGRPAWIAFVADTLFFAFAALVEEVTFRGYAFQRFRSVVGPVGATLGFAVFYAGLQALLPGSGRVSAAVSVAFSLVLSITYLRTRALWIGWGLNFGWKASRALLFGLSVSGISRHSSIIEGDPMGPFWLTGGGFGLDGTWIACIVLLAAIPVVYRVTRDLDFEHNAPVLVAGGLPVNVEPAAQNQHDSYMNSGQPATPAPLVQILPLAAPNASNEESAVIGTEPDNAD